MNNRKEFLALIERYETITLDEIEAAFKKYGFDEAAEKLTKFGHPFIDTLCQAVDIDCTLCEWCKLTPDGCISGGKSNSTWNAIHMAKTPFVLLTAYRARAAYMRECLAGAK